MYRTKLECETNPGEITLIGGTKVFTVSACSFEPCEGVCTFSGVAAISVEIAAPFRAVPAGVIGPEASAEERRTIIFSNEVPRANSFLPGATR